MLNVVPVPKSNTRDQVVRAARLTQVETDQSPVSGPVRLFGSVM